MAIYRSRGSRTLVSCIEKTRYWDNHCGPAIWEWRWRWEVDQHGAPHSYAYGAPHSFRDGDWEPLCARCKQARLMYTGRHYQVRPLGDMLVTEAGQGRIDLGIHPNRSGYTTPVELGTYSKLDMIYSMTVLSPTATITLAGTTTLSGT